MFEVEITVWGQHTFFTGEGHKLHAQTSEVFQLGEKFQVRRSYLFDICPTAVQKDASFFVFVLSDFFSLVGSLRTRYGKQEQQMPLFNGEGGSESKNSRHPYLKATPENISLKRGGPW